LPIEVKAGRAVRVHDARAVDAFCAERALPFGLVLYDGADIVRLSATAIAVPLTVALAQPAPAGRQGGHLRCPQRSDDVA
jgi:hypothetical protein